MKLSSWPRYLLLSTHFAMVLFGSAMAAAGCPVEKQQVCINSLTDLSVPALRDRIYASTFQPLEQIDSDASTAFMLSYGSEDLRLYSRLDLPPSPTPQGLPMVVLAPGWISRDEAASWDFGSDPATTVGTVRDAMVSANFAVAAIGIVDAVTAGTAIVYLTFPVWFPRSRKIAA